MSSGLGFLSLVAAVTSAVLLSSGVPASASPIPSGYQPVYFGACVGIPTCIPPPGTVSERFTVLSSFDPAVSTCVTSPCLVQVPLYSTSPYFYTKEFLELANFVIIGDPFPMPLNIMPTSPSVTVTVTVITELGSGQQTATAIPEDTTLTMWIAGLLSLGGWWRWRRIHIVVTC